METARFVPCQNSDKIKFICSNLVHEVIMKYENQLTFYERNTKHILYCSAWFIRKIGFSDKAWNVPRVKKNMHNIPGFVRKSNLSDNHATLPLWIYLLKIKNKFSLKQHKNSKPSYPQLAVEIARWMAEKFALYIDVRTGLLSMVNSPLSIELTRSALLWEVERTLVWKLENVLLSGGLKHYTEMLASRLAFRSSKFASSV